MTYTEFVARIVAWLQEDVAEANFAAALPGIIEAAELRCYRDCDFLTAHSVSLLPVGGGALPPYATSTPLPADYVVADEVILGGAVLSRRDPSFLDVLVGAAPPVPGLLPKYWAEDPPGILRFGPAMALPTPGSLRYLARARPLSVDNPTTPLSLLAPDLMFAAAMVAGSGYVRNFGAQGDDPKMAVSWEQQYQTALAGLRREQALRKGQGNFDSSVNPPPSSGLPPT